jgi:hypothetical protein
LVVELKADQDEDPNEHHREQASLRIRAEQGTVVSMRLPIG